jgi:hypothetical protein
VNECTVVIPWGRYCEKHRGRMRRHGDPTVVKKLWHATRAERLAAYTDRSGGPDACWPWTNARSESGYGVITARGGGTAIASRAAYEEAHGVILDPSTVVMHLCNNPPCCNPAHLRAGTMAENQRYMAQSGRSHTGVRNTQAKLTGTEVAHMRGLRAEGWKLADLAERFGVSQAQVSRISNGKQRLTG